MEQRTKMEYVFPYWGPLVFETQIDNELIDLLLEKGRETTKDARKDLVGQIDKELYYDNYYEWFIPKFEIYIKSYVDAAKNYADNIPMKRILAGWYLEKLWINYQKANEYNPPHEHTGDLSFVIYLQVPEEIVKENEKMKGVHNNDGPGVINFWVGSNMPFAINKFSKMPSAGDIFIFPAWLPHYVNAFKSDVERISVSGNICFASETATQS
tara:strand:+ start:49 stop:684 length:636 start_codon:yes stop_codon:yes gene_type:complete